MNETFAELMMSGIALWITIVGTPDGKLFAAQYSARVFPCQRFADTLTDARA